MIYGADIAYEKNVEIKDLLNDNVVDKASWNEFMPEGVTKEIFKDFIKYYDVDVFNAAGRRIRNIVKNADTLTPTERVKEIAHLFSYFKNPDKETVLTPWRVVNMHLSDCLGGYDFFDEAHTTLIESPRFVNQGTVTDDTLANTDAQILEINSKTGLYPLFVAYSIFRKLCPDIDNTTKEEQQKIWQAVVTKNVFVICRTLMAKRITQRTLCGFGNTKANARYFENLVDTLKDTADTFINEVSKPSYWEKKGDKMKFNAVVGNPPYQENVGSTSNKALGRQLFPDFMKTSFLLTTSYVSLITPSRWFTGEGQDASFPKLRKFIKEHNHFVKIYNYLNQKDIFPNVSIGTINYFLYQKQYNGDVDFYDIVNGKKDKFSRPLFENDMDTIIPMNILVGYTKKITNRKDFVSLTTITTGRNPFGVPDVNTQLKRHMSQNKTKENDIKIFCAYEEINYVPNNLITRNNELIKKWKIFTSKMNGGAGNLSDDKEVFILGRSFVGEPGSICSGALISIGGFSTKTEAVNLQKYMKTKFLRFTVGLMKSSQALYQNVYQFVPMQDFTKNSDIKWNKTISEIDKQLYDKYGLSPDEIEFIEQKIKPME